VIVPIRAFVHATEICPRRGAGQDRVSVSSTRDRIVIALADGAGGTAGGERAANAVIDAVAAAQLGADAPERGGGVIDDWTAVLTELELDPDRLGPGQTTAVVATVTQGGIRGASAGDSGAWVIRGGEIEDLTRAQHRKPLIGDHSIALPFQSGPLAGGTLLVASDGLLRYAKPEAIARVAGGPDLAAAARELVALVRLPSGEVPDDVSVVLCREAGTHDP
jgi:serine/threonine protein phosphatase PrpC